MAGLKPGFRRRRANHLAGRFLGIGLGLVFLSLVGYLFFSDLFRVVGVVCLQDEADCWPSVWAEFTGQIEGESLFFLSPRRQSHWLLAHYSEFSQARVTKIWPRMVKIELTTKKPVFEICQVESIDQMVTSEICQAYSIDGMSLGQCDKQGLPRLKTTHDWEPTPTLIDLYQELAFQEMSLGESIWQEAEEVEVRVLGRRIIFSLTKDPVWQVDSLQEILAQAKMNEKPVVEVDFRFEKPVVRFRQEDA